EAAEAWAEMGRGAHDGMVCPAGRLQPLWDGPLYRCRDSDHMNTVGEPYSGKPNVRFDEGRPGEALPTRAAYSTLDAAISPARVLLSKANDGLAAGASIGGLRARRPRSVGCPALLDQFAMPSQQGLRAGEQRWPGGRWQEAAEGTQEEPIGRLPAGTTELAL